MRRLLFALKVFVYECLLLGVAAIAGIAVGMIVVIAAASLYFGFIVGPR